MREELRAKLNANRDKFINELDISVVFLAKLLARGVINEEQKSQIWSKPTPHEQADKLIDVLGRSNDVCYDGFCAVLKEVKSDLVKYLSATSINLYAIEERNTLGSNGNKKSLTSAIMPSVINKDASIPAEIQNSLLLKRMAMSERTSAEIENSSRTLSHLSEMYDGIRGQSSDYTRMENLSLIIDPVVLKSATKTNRKFANGARLAGLLINVGTATVKEMFDKKVEYYMKNEPIRRGGKLATFLRAHKSTLTDYHDGKSIPRLINDDQWEMIYPTDVMTNVSLSEFDLTLLNLLVRLLKLFPMPSTGWNIMPNNTDNSKAAHLVRLRIMRNELYGHVTTTEYADYKFNEEWKKLKTTLLHLGASQESIDKWRDVVFDETEMHCKLGQLLANDMDDMRAIEVRMIEKLENMSSSIAGKFNDMGLTEKLLDLKSEYVNGQKEDEFRTGKTLDLLDTLLKNDEASFKILENLHNSVHQLNTGIQEIRKEMNLIKTKVEYLGIPTVPLQQSLLLIKSELEQNHQNQDKVLNILILSSISKDISCKESYKQLGTAIGYCPWNIILDLDYDSMTDQGMFHGVEETLRKQRDIKVVTYKETTTVTQQELGKIAESDMALWIQANGCSTKGCSPSLQQFGRAITDLQIMMKEIFLKFPVKKSLCQVSPVFVLMNSSMDELSVMQRLGQMISDLCEYNFEKITKKHSTFYILKVEEAQCSDLNILPPTGMNKISVEAPFMQFVSLFFTCYGKNLDKRYIFPGNKGDCELTPEKHAQLQPVMTLYDRDIGKLNFDDMTKEQMELKITEVTINFLKGSSLTPEALNLHGSKEIVYVERKEMKEIKQIVREELAKGQQYTGNKQNKTDTYVIQHDASWGGTTCGRYLLFSLKDEYPSIEIKHIDETLIEGLLEISHGSKKPLFMVADGLGIQAVCSLRQRLVNEKVSGLIVHVVPNLTQHCRAMMATGVKNNFTIQSVVTDKEDKLAFEKLYKQKQKKINTKTVFLYGLCTFLDEYAKLGTHIQTCVEETTPAQKRILRVIIYMWKYAHTSIDLRIVAKLLKSDDEDDDDEDDEDDLDYMKSLGYARDLLIETQGAYALRPAHQCIVEPVLKALGPNKPGEQISLFVRDLEIIVSKDNNDRRDSFKLLHSVFFQRDRTLDSQPWSKFIIDLETQCGKERVSEVLSQLVKMFTGSNKAHLQTLYARYLMIAMRAGDEALEQIRMALNLEDGQQIADTTETDVLLLTAYGSLFRSRVITLIKDFSTGRTVKKPEAEMNNQLDRVYKHATESVDALERGQSETISEPPNQYNAAAFWLEADICSRLLRFSLENVCGDNHETFQQYINGANAPPLLKESSIRAWKALDTLKYLRKLDKMKDDSPYKTKGKENDIKLELLRSLSSQPWNQNFPKDGLQNYPKNAPCDIGHFILNATNQNIWKNVCFNDLELIISEIDKRIPNPPLMLQANYEDFILALIHIRKFRTVYQNLETYNLLRARKCAEQWVLLYEQSIDAYFMLGFLKLLQGLDKGSLQLITDAQDSFRKCRHLFENHKSARCYRKKEFWIGIGTGLDKAVPFEKGVSTALLETFEGHMNSDKILAVHCAGSDNAFTAEIIDKMTENIKFVPHQQRLLKFNLILARDSIIATNIRIADKSDI